MDVRERLTRELLGDEESDTPAERKSGNQRYRDECLTVQPATIAAHCLIRSILGTSFSVMSRRPQALMIVMSDLAWTEPVRDAWRLHFKAGECEESLNSATPGSAQPNGWFCIRQAGRATLGSKSLVGAEEVERALTAGGELLLLAHDLTTIPVMVRAAMDRIVELPPMNPSVLRHVAESICLPRGDWCCPSEQDVAAVGPSALRLATRRGDSATDYAQRAVMIAALSIPTAGKDETPGPRGLARVPGMGPVLEWGRALAHDLAAYRKGDLPWSAVDRGCLLVGPPGTGKTTFSRALAEECGVPLVLGSHSAWQAAGHQGEMLKSMRSTFAEARAAAPCILFVDEVDSFPDRAKERSENASYLREIVNGFLAELDGTTSRDGVVVVGACNSLAWIDHAILRAGRLDRVIPVALPDARGIADILRVHLGSELAGADLHQVARLAEGMSGAEVERSVREARRTARTTGRPLLMGDVLIAVAEYQKIELTTCAPLVMN